MSEVNGKHYDLECNISSITIIEEVISREGISHKQGFCIANALKYLLRLGVKHNKIEEDLAKAENYLHRAIRGDWINVPEEKKK